MKPTLRRILIEFDDAPTGNDELALMKYQEAEAKLNAYIAGIIGEDDVQAWDDVESFCVRCGFQPTDDTRQCICTQRNKLRHTQRKRAGINTTEGSAS